VNEAENIHLDINNTKSHSGYFGWLSEDRSTNWLPQPEVSLYDLFTGFQPQAQLVNYPALLGLTASLRAELPASTTHFADTGVSTGSAVSTGVDESGDDSFAHQKSKISGDVSSECPTPSCSTG